MTGLADISIRRYEDDDPLRWDDQGLITTVVQHDVTGAVLMVAWMDQTALQATRDTGQVHFWSRSRQELWRKGETSGNVLKLVSVLPDCDGDTLLVRARPSGPVCHTGAETCFGESHRIGLADLDVLWERITERLDSDDPDSYTKKLVAAGVEGPGRKLVEESTEVLLAAKDHDSGAADDKRLAEEAADVLYHLLVVLAERGVSPAMVMEVLRDRRG